MSEQSYDRVLTHIGGFSSHIGSGNKQHAPLLIEQGIVCNKGFLQHLLYHQMPSRDDFEHLLVTKLWLA